MTRSRPHTLTTLCILIDDVRTVPSGSDERGASCPAGGGSRWLVRAPRGRCPASCLPLVATMSIMQMRACRAGRGPLGDM